MSKKKPDDFADVVGKTAAKIINVIGGGEKSAEGESYHEHMEDWKSEADKKQEEAEYLAESKKGLRKFDKFKQGSK